MHFLVCMLIQQTNSNTIREHPKNTLTEDQKYPSPQNQIEYFRAIRISQLLQSSQIQSRVLSELCNRCCRDYCKEQPQDCQFYQTHICNCNYIIGECDAPKKDSDDSTINGLKVFAGIVGTIIVFIGWACYCCRRSEEQPDQRSDVRPDDDPPIWNNENLRNQEANLQQQISIAPKRSKYLPPLDGVNKTCSICLEGIDRVHEKKITCPSQHIFHKECIEKWLALHKTCPECRAEVNL